MSVLRTANQTYWQHRWTIYPRMIPRLSNNRQTDHHRSKAFPAVPHTPPEFLRRSPHSRIDCRWYRYRQAKRHSPGRCTLGNDSTLDRRRISAQEDKEILGVVLLTAVTIGCRSGRGQISGGAWCAEFALTRDEGRCQDGDSQWIHAKQAHVARCFFEFGERERRRGSRCRCARSWYCVRECRVIRSVCGELSGQVYQKPELSRLNRQRGKGR